MQTPFETVVDSLVVRLSALVAGKVEGLIALELGTVQHELCEAAREYREEGGDLGEALAASLEAASERITREWTERYKLEGVHSTVTGKPRHSQHGVELNGHGPKRPRGRPRKSPQIESFGEHDASESTRLPPTKEIDP